MDTLMEAYEVDIGPQSETDEAANEGVLLEPCSIRPETESEDGVRVFSRNTGLPAGVLKLKFAWLEKRWRSEVSHQSNLLDRIQHPIYQEIVAAGMDIAPILFERIREGQIEWSFALAQLLDVDLTTEVDSPTHDALMNYWLQWGDAHPEISTN